LTNGNIIENDAFQKTDINNLGKKQKIVYSFALELLREIGQHLSLVLGAKYETNVTYNVSSQLKQSIRPLYLSSRRTVPFLNISRYHTPFYDSH